MVDRKQGSVAFGISLPTSAADQPVELESLVSLAKIADDAGISSIACGDHLLWHSPLVDPFVALSVVGSMTSRASLMTAVLIAPLRHPIWIAKQSLSVNWLMSDRFVLGVGVGGEYPKEFHVLDRDVDERRSLMREALSVLEPLRLGMTNQASRDYASLMGEMAPELKEGIPLWVGGRSTAAMNRAAGWGDGWLGLFVPPEKYRDVVRRLRESTELAGRHRRDVLAGIQLFVCIDDDQEEARRRAEAYCRRHFGMPGERILEHAALGPPAVVLDRVRSYVDAGADLVQFHMIGGMYQQTLERLLDALGPLLPAPTLRQIGAMPIVGSEPTSE
jgi:alkanesulfonate monooxygenase SsuD/methylene tetrahydromethanopterin reductase-like flavin-dependent oxidoreductase (luciferase family)